MQEFQQIEFEKDYDQARWILPARDLGPYASFGWIVFALGLFITLFMIAWISGPLYFGVSLIAEGEWFGLAVIAFSLAGFGGLFFGLRILTLGYRIVKNRTRSEVIIAKDRLLSVEKLGWFDWRRKVWLKNVLELQIKDSSKMGKRGNSPFSLGKELKALVATTSNSKFMIAVGYSGPVINQLANELSSEIGRAIASNSVGDMIRAAPSGTANEVPITTNSEIRSVPEKPVASKIVMQDQGEHRAYKIPATGFKRLAGFLLVFSCFWILISSVVLVSLAQTGAGDLLGSDIVGLIVLISFLGVGILMLVGSVYLARRRLMIGILSDQLFVERKSIFGVKWMEFAIVDIRRIYVGDSGMEVNDQPVRELKIEFRQKDKPLGLLSQLEENELQWLAYSLAQDLGVETTEDGDLVTWQDELGEVGELRLPLKSRISIDERVDGVRINVPRKMSYWIGAVCVGLVFLFMGAAIAWHAATGNFDFVGVAFGLVFVGTGLLVCLVCLEFGTRRFEFEVDGAVLTVYRFSLLSRKRIEIHQDDIQSINIGFSGIKTNNQKSYQLQIRAGGRSFNGMTHWSKPEIAVVAGRLNQSLEIRQDPVTAENPRS